MPVPYVILSPGPTLNTLDKDERGSLIIVITGHSARATTGHLNLTTVQIASTHVTALQALVGWAQHDEVVVPRAAVYPPGQSSKQAEQQEAQQFTESQDSAVVAALCQLGYPRGLGVLGVVDGTGAAGVLKPQDQLLAVNDTPVKDATTLTSVLATLTPGDTARVGIRRAGLPSTERVVLGKPANGGKGARLGINAGPSCFAPFYVNLGLGGQVGGPSAGLMFALGIIDKLGSTDLTSGRFVAGTGEITTAGEVRPIGGIQLKMIGARRAGATVFLAPGANCGDVRGSVPAGLSVVKITSLSDALDQLARLRTGQAVSRC
jgi:PDZ domain-containing protein